MTVRELIKKLSSYKEELQDKNVMCLQENGEIMSCEPKLVLKDKHKLEFTKENVDYIIIT